MTKNKNSTRYYSSIQENHVAKTLNGVVSSNSGAGCFMKSDVFIRDSNMSVECKTCISPKESFSIKKEWFEKHKKEAFSCGIANTAIAISFDPEGTENYYIINESLFRYLCEKLSDDEI